MRTGEAAIAEATGRPPRLFRPPYGIFSAAGLAIARRHYQPMLWSRWGRDWRGDATPSSIGARAGRGARAGDVILLHDADHYSAAGSWRNTVAALPLLLDELDRAGRLPVAIPQ